MDKLDRANTLKENGVTPDAAFDTAQMDFNDIPDEWKEYFD